jgi:hypothetical protein
MSEESGIETDNSELSLVGETHVISYSIDTSFIDHTHHRHLTCTDSNTRLYSTGIYHNPDPFCRYSV